MKEDVKKYREIISYLIVGVLTTVVSMAAYYCCIFTFLNPQNPIQLQLANVISWIFAVLFAYFANRKIVFQSKNKMVKEVIGFFGSRLLTLGLDMLLMFIFVTVCKMDDKVVKVFVQVIVVLANYIVGKFYVFQDRAEKDK